MGLKSPRLRRALNSIDRERQGMYDPLTRERMAFIEDHQPEQSHELPKGWTNESAHSRVNQLAGELGMDKSMVLREVMMQASELSVCTGGAETLTDDDLFETAFSKVSEYLKRNYSF